MRYLDFSSPRFIIEVSKNIVNQYRLVEAISDDQIEIILQRVNQELLKEIGDTRRPSALRAILSRHGFAKNRINQILAGIDSAKKTTSEPDVEPESEPPEEPISRPKEEPVAEPQVSKPTLRVSIDDAKKEIKKLSYQYPNIDQEVEEKIRNMARSAMNALESGDNNEIFKALNSQLELINQQIEKMKSKTEGVYETSTSGGTAAGSVASVAAPLGAVIRRMPPGQSFFAPTTVRTRKKTTKKAKKH